MENNNKFSYTYSAKQQDEVNRIRDKYVSKSEDKMERLRKLDASVTKKATAVAVSLGVVGTLILGLGMSLVMTDISSILGNYESIATIVGIAIGLVGILLASVAYPIYKKTVETERKRIAPEIIRLSDEIMENK